MFVRSWFLPICLLAGAVSTALAQPVVLSYSRAGGAVTASVLKTVAKVPFEGEQRSSQLITETVVATSPGSFQIRSGQDVIEGSRSIVEEVQPHRREDRQRQKGGHRQVAGKVPRIHDS